MVAIDWCINVVVVCSTLHSLSIHYCFGSYGMLVSNHTRLVVFPSFNPKMNRMKAHFFILTLLISLLCACGDEETDTVLSGQVINAFTDEPIEGATVTVLEDGPSATTGANGTFQFSNEAVETLEDISNGSGDFAVYIDHPDFRPRETNVVRGSKAALELAPKDVPVYFYYPPVQLNDGIATGSLKDAGMDRQLIQNMMDKLHGNGYSEVHSILVYKSDRLVMEEYFFGNNDTIQFENGITVDKSPAPIQWTRNEKHYVASVNKALTSTVVGMALASHDVSVNDKISEYVPEYASYFENANKASIDFEDCLTMTAGFQWDEWGDTDLARLWKTEDFGDFVLSRNNAGPGFEWRYNSALPNLMLKAVDNIVGGGVREWADANFYAKLGITDYKWQSQPDGYPEGSARMYLRPRDMLKIGVTYLDNGMWGGEQVIPQQWVSECMQVKEETSSGDYSYHFWIRNLADTEYLSADGDGGNYINVFPSLDMVIVITQGHYLKWPLYVVQSDDMMQNYIIPAAQ